MSSHSAKDATQQAASFVDSLSAYSRQHRAKHWSGTFEEFMRDVLPSSPRALARTSHEYLWDMLGWYGRNAKDVVGTEARKSSNGNDDFGPSTLFKRELFGVD